MKQRAEIGVFGGSGFYSLFKKAEEVSIRTTYGVPSSKVTVARVSGRMLAFIPRHGTRHQFPPHSVPYMANVSAFAALGVTRVIAPTAVGSLRPEVGVGDFVFCDQFVNFTSGRKDSFYDGPVTTHVSTADPYCPEMRKIGLEAAQKMGLKSRRTGTVVVIQGPRFSTRSESRFFRSQGWDVVNMTQYPEVVLAREKEMCYLNVSVVTDYDVGLEGDPRVVPVSHEAVVKAFNRNIGKLKELIAEVARTLPKERGCECGKALEHARLEA
ncbi:MAG: S-methyl-5'-thioadenosine phosphorylase [Thaumarchaeota archaeon]|nr:S-methyl-5'-thioadenosine phosphorylase [Nitrososphaerota archaeon]